ncbi:MAG: SND2/TMEM208 family protein [Methanobrevibacter sp.]|jgi:energy-converting hydrogenase A subunit I|nr:SND2/TMEM208 family protein [Candidatus Methanovirga meridionalis]
MRTLVKYGYIILTVSLVFILYCLIFNPASWIVYSVAIVFIPLFILSFGLITMATPKKDEEEDRAREPFIGY